MAISPPGTMSDVRDLRVAEVVKLDLTIDEGKVTAYRARLNISFKYEVNE